MVLRIGFKYLIIMNSEENKKQNKANDGDQRA